MEDRKSESGRTMKLRIEGTQGKLKSELNTRNQRQMAATNSFVAPQPCEYESLYNCGVMQML